VTHVQSHTASFLSSSSTEHILVLIDWTYLPMHPTKCSMRSYSWLWKNRILLELSETPDNYGGRKKGRNPIHNNEINVSDEE
jgi:hypothetical protein